MSVWIMSDHVVCPHCGKHLAKGSTFCINCGNRVPEDLRTITTEADSLTWDEPVTTASPQTDESVIAPDSSSEISQSTEDEIVELPPVELSWEDAETPGEASLPPVEPQLDSPPLKPIDDTASEKAPDLSWDDVDTLVEEAESVPKAKTPLGTPPLRPIDDTIKAEKEDLSWEEPELAPDTIEQGEPFKEIEPPKVFSEDDKHFPETEPPTAVDDIESTTDDAITHLFPEGCSDTTPDFIDAVVGEAKKITISTPMLELETPTCPSCGTVLTGDDFEYPPYVYSAMGKARLDHGIKLLNENQPQEAIESFERAKKLYEKADDEKMIEIAIGKIDEGYDGMGNAHFELGERHLKEGEFEWAIVQFRKAREIYMLSTDKKLRAKCAEMIRIGYLAWGKSLEDEADRVSKQGDVRTALERYRQAAEKYRDGGDNKRLKGLEKKIRKA
jgi:hypothetical protein